MRRREVQLDPEVVLDPRTYQDLVDEARTRVGRRCPEWTDHNVSDPGMTLIDQFAWMTDLLLYRVNRIPERLHWRLLELLGVRRQPPTDAETWLRFRLAAPPVDEPKLIPAGTEVATVPDDEHPAIVFRTSEDASVPPIKLAAMTLRRSGTSTEIADVSDGTAFATENQDAYSALPEPGDAIYLGFVTSPARLVLQVHVRSTEAHGTGIDPDLPPVRWGVPLDDTRWQDDVEVLTEGTGGFNYPVGTTEVGLPPMHEPTTIAGKTMYWLGCRVVEPPHGRDRYAAAPRIEEVSVTAIGVLTPARHCMLIGHELLGTSDGTPGQTFTVLHAPALELGPGEHVEVSDRDQLFYEAWEEVDTFAGRLPDEHVFRFDAATGEVQFGPPIRVPGGWQQHGAIPPKDARIMMSGYRHGGGLPGNVERGRLTVMRKPILGVASVTNPRPAHGGTDLETVDEANLRAAEELGTHHRAVTRRDFERIACLPSRVARARCIKPDPRGPIVVQILPFSERPDGRHRHDDLVASDGLLADVTAVLEAACLLGASVHVTPIPLRMITVAVEVQMTPTSSADDLQARICDALHVYLNPFVGGDLHAVSGERAGTGSGWPWGRDLSQSEIRALVLAVPGVERITILRLYDTDVRTGLPIEGELEGPVVLERGELIASGPHVARAVTPVMA